MKGMITIFTKFNKKTVNSISKNGINISGRISMKNAHDVNPKFVYIRAFIVAITAISSIFLGCSFIKLDINYFALFIYGILITSLYCCYNFISNNKKKIATTTIIVHSIIMTLLVKKYWLGFLVVADEYLSTIKSYSKVSKSLISSVPSGSESLYATIAVAIIMTILIAILSLTCFYKNNFLFSFLFTFPFFEIGAFWGLVPNYLCFIILIICWVSIFSMQLANWNWIHIKGKSAFTLKPNSQKFFISSKELIRLSSSIIVLTMLALSFATVIGILLISNLFNYQRPDSVNDLRYQIKEAFNDFSIDKIPSIFDDLKFRFDIAPTKSVGGTNGGKLGRNSGIKFNNKVALEITSVTKPGDLYLKGYCAGAYTGNSWDEFKPSLYNKYKDIFEKDKDVIFQNLNFDMLLSTLEDGYLGDAGLNSLEINVKDASKKYYYAPYFTNFQTANNSEPNHESFVWAKKDKYSYEFLDINNQINESNTLKYYNLLFDSPYLSDDYLKYEEFIYNNYGNVDFDVIGKAYNEIVKNYLSINIPGHYDYKTNGIISPESFDLDISEISDAISSYFSDNYKYSLNPGKTPSDKDFVKYFLEEQDKGYCSYFASAGVLLMRSFGYKARFAEGYLVLTNEFTLNEADGSYRANPTDKDAHAWCEVFVSGIGWLPVEFTPGFSDGENPNDREDIDNPDSSTITTTITTTNQSSNDNNDNSNTSSDTTDNSDLNISKNESVNGTLNTTDNSNNPTNYGNIVKIFLSIILVIFVIILVFLIWDRTRKCKVHLISENIRNKNRNKAILSIYKQCLKLFSLLDIEENNNYTDIATTNELKSAFESKDVSDFSDYFAFITNLAVEADMSQNTISEDDYRKAYDLYLEIRNVVWKKLNRSQRIFAKYFKFYY